MRSSDLNKYGLQRKTEIMSKEQNVKDKDEALYIGGVIKSKRFTGIVLKGGGYEAEDVYDVGDGLFLNKCEIEQLKQSLENTQKTYFL